MKDPLYKSLLGHLVLVLIVILDMPSLWRKDMSIHQVPIIVDLKDVKISEMTNLPPKVKLGKENKEASTIKRKKENYTQKEEKPKTAPAKQEPVKQAEAEPIKQEAKPSKESFLVAPPPAKPKNKPKEKEKPKTAEPKKTPPKKTEPKKEEKPENKDPVLANPLKSLLASVDALEKELGSKDEHATTTSTEGYKHQGVDGGTVGSYFSELSISETDLLAGRLRACWNLDPGARGIQDMIIEIRVHLTPEGKVQDTKILDTNRYSSDKHFRSVAESARRAVYVCAPYTIFVEKYAEQYDMWKTMLLRFNPLDGEVK